MSETEEKAVGGMRLTTGELVIGVVGVHKEVDSLFILNPMYLNMKPTEDGKISMGLSPVAPYAESNQIEISPTAIVYTFSLNKPIVDSYLNAVRQIESGLVVPPTKKIIT